MDRYPALRIIVRAAGPIAWAAAGIFILGGLFTVSQGGVKGLIGFVGSAIFATLAWLGVKSYAEMIQVFVNIEENTRRLVGEENTRRLVGEGNAGPPVGRREEGV